MTSRRAILIGATSLVMTGRAGVQQRIYRMGYLSPLSVAASAPTRAAFFNRLEELGYRSERNLVVEHRAAEGRLDLLPGLAAELVALKPDILFAVGTQATLAASKATGTVPIVFVAVTDPEGLNHQELATAGHQRYRAQQSSGRATAQVIATGQGDLPARVGCGDPLQPAQRHRSANAIRPEASRRDTRTESEGDRSEGAGRLRPGFQAVAGQATRRAVC